MDNNGVLSSSRECCKTTWDSQMCNAGSSCSSNCIATLLIERDFLHPPQTFPSRWTTWETTCQWVNIVLEQALIQNKHLFLNENTPCSNVSHSRLLKHCGIKWRGIYDSQTKTERVHAEKSKDWLSHSVSAAEIAINPFQT